MTLLLFSKISSNKAMHAVKFQLFFFYYAVANRPQGNFSFKYSLLDEINLFQASYPFSSLA